ncbi:MAG: NAD(P)/FAD-dependent oxidoreductase [Planctomycetes bacterium]|nr:NAD(P)/FAD-dependent oxidoreductase [Planctomycetota bacterium]
MGFDYGPLEARYDAIVIGAGMAGLAAAIRLAMFDVKVVVLEKHYMPGGLNSYYHRAKRPFDVGLHAMTNYAPKGAKRMPLTKLLRQLRIPHDALQLAEQGHSEVRFPGVTLPFTNDFQVLRGAIAEAFPDQADRFDGLVAAIEAFDNLSLDREQLPARPVLAQHLSDPLLIDMLLCPLMYYGSAVEDDMEFGQFVTMFKSIFLEGFARPEGGVRTLTDLLKARLKEVGGEVRFKRGVKRILSKDGKVFGVELEKDDQVIEAPVVISTAGHHETVGLCEALPQPSPETNPVGQLSFMESIHCLDCEPKALGLDQTIVFFNDSERFHYRAAEDYADLRSGVICMPNNYRHQTPLEEGLVRITSIANFAKWAALEKPEPYGEVKERWRAAQAEVAAKLLGEFREHVVYHDTFTPTTILHFTGHQNGAIYGAPTKLTDGLTGVDGLFLAGTDQGFLGIVGAMLSGISIANARVLTAR